ncbi:MAG: hypothetical protein LBL35_09090 [Clostridiales bacterium]|jgi:hypothetical protein|nr:hypothetical protein [Clostridiales bacterium]
MNKITLLRVLSIDQETFSPHIDGWFYDSALLGIYDWFGDNPLSPENADSLKFIPILDIKYNDGTYAYYTRLRLNFPRKNDLKKFEATVLASDEFYKASNFFNDGYIYLSDPTSVDYHVACALKKEW